MACRNLDLSHNTMGPTVPTEITRLSNLQSLQLSYNSLSEIGPTGISALTALTLYDISFAIRPILNGRVNPPPALWTMPSLRSVPVPSFDVGGKPCCSLLWHATLYLHVDQGP